MNEAAGDAGLCSRCAHRREVPGRRGALYLLCRRSAQDRSYPRYPRLPVVRCPGFEGVPGPADASPARVQEGSGDGGNRGRAGDPIP